MRRLTIVVFTVLILGSILTVGFGSATSTTTQYQETKTGISTGPVSENNIENFETIQSTLEQFGVDPPSEITMLATPDGERHIVFSSEPIPAGEATINGRTFSTSEVTGQIIVADTVSVETTGDRISITDLQDNPAEYDHEIVRFDADATVVSTAAKPTTGVASQQTVAYLTESGNGSSDLFTQPPGELASTAAIIESNGSVERNGEFEPQFPENSLWAQSFSQQFWGEGTATVDAALVPVYQQGADGESTIVNRELVIVDVNYDSQTLNSPAEIRNGGYEGEIVTVESDVAGASLSTQEYLTSVASCGDKTVSVPMSPPVCVPVTNDIVVHTGVMADGVSAGEMPVYYTSISNTIQNSPTETETGRYQLTGEVVSTSEIDPSLEDGYALRVYDMARVGDASIASSVASDANQFEERIKSQLELDESEWGTESSGEESDDKEGDDSSTGSQLTGEDDSTTSPNPENEGGSGGSESDTQRNSDTTQTDGSNTAQTDGVLASVSGADIGAILGVISISVFVLGIVLEGARGFKNRYGDADPNLTEQVTTAVVTGASVGLVVSGFLVDSDWGLLLLLFGGVGVVTFVSDYLWRAILRPLVKQNLDYGKQQSKAAKIIGIIVFFLGTLGLLAILGSIFSVPGVALIFYLAFTILSAGTVLFGAVVGMIRTYKKHLVDDKLNTVGNLGLAITFVGSLGVVTAGTVGGEFGEGVILVGGLALVVCFLVAISKAIYQIV